MNLPHPCFGDCFMLAVIFVAFRNECTFVRGVFFRRVVTCPVRLFVWFGTLAVCVLKAETDG